MSQPNSEPTSLFVFRIVVSAIFCGFLGYIIGMIYGPIGIPMSFALGIGGVITLRVLFEKQIIYSYWWLRVLWELNTGNNQ